VQYKRRELVLPIFQPACDNIRMGYRAMQLACYCGAVPERILEVGYTSARNLVVHFWCSACSRVLFVSMSPEECAEACPQEDTYAERQAATEDARFLQSLGIAVTD